MAAAAHQRIDPASRARRSRSGTAGCLRLEEESLDFAFPPLPLALRGGDTDGAAAKQRPLGRPGSAEALAPPEAGAAQPCPRQRSLRN